ncbi:3'-5' exonuclease [Oceanirhabdus sp. W0125-5]|uniref:3'-5' exonuclease n=1 Tax=Oceanirhabdus sp. W0125-5 TaxID=2999116 RepID=UPI0022F2FB9F|nr:3'-5' exonuclease [Oceanirhabdus sp. W0125-5]WBW96073.1 3'-5' exonuclease [Oceanirhabdus sp. W0125-5]
MEFENVIIINCNEEIIPYVKSMHENIEEERRLFYVGITRTSQNLWLDHCRFMRNRSMEPSRFLYEMGSLREMTPYDYSVGETGKHISFGLGEISYLDKKEIEIVFQNNVKRKFDVMVLLRNDMIQKV